MKGLPTEVQTFLSSNHLATIATISQEDDFPHVVPIFYTVDDVFNVRFSSHKNSKKIKNIQTKPHVTLSITNQENLTSLQLQGVATVDANHEPEIIEKILNSANNNNKDSMAPLMKIAGDDFITVTFIITWFKFSNYSKEKPTYTENSLE